MEVPRLSAKEALILELLVQGKNELYGLEMVNASSGQLARGTVYVTLDRMEDKGFVESQQESPGPNVRGIPRRLYRVTGHGRVVYTAWQRFRAATAILNPAASRA